MFRISEVLSAYWDAVQRGAVLTHQPEAYGMLAPDPTQATGTPDEDGVGEGDLSEADSSTKSSSP